MDWSGLNWNLGNIPQRFNTACSLSSNRFTRLDFKSDRWQQTHPHGARTDMGRFDTSAQ